MKRCPNCGYIVPAAGPGPRRWAAAPPAGGAPPPPAPAPPARVPAPVPPPPLDDALLPGGARVNGHSVPQPHQPLPERPAGPDTWLPRIDPALLAAEAEPPQPRVSKQAMAIGAVALGCLIPGRYAAAHRKHHETSAPTILAPR